MKILFIKSVLCFLILSMFNAYAAGPKSKNTTPSLALPEDVVAGLTLMREEEKLARDVYLALYTMHGTAIFSNIANSEQSHMDALKKLLDRYALNDPVGANLEGIFTSADLQQLYFQLLATGSSSTLDALYVGATVEELDIYDLQRLLTEVETNSDIAVVYENLLRGSRNHLRSFHKLIVKNGGSYSPVFISQTHYDDIVNSPMERGRR
ncbi:hypothetical protein SAMN02745866_00861 [Alteromonadaceae bacterium Bs31]|nr:hypothetical protein SAMN02745866_00861 [Alteromonadaceae bacterium Bs31]